MKYLKKFENHSQYESYIATDFVKPNVSYITSVTLSNNLTSISVGVFDWCTSLESVDVPDSVTNIMPAAFRHCESLTAATIGSGITTIGAEAFRTCRELTSLTIKATTPPTLADSVVFESNDNCIFYVPSESVNTYKAAQYWSTYASRIQAIPS